MSLSTSMTTVVGIPLVTVLAVRSVAGDAGDVGLTVQIGFGTTMFCDTGSKVSSCSFI